MNKTTDQRVNKRPRCNKCIYNGECSEECRTCNLPEDYNIHYEHRNMRLPENFENTFEQTDTTTSSKATDLPEDIEDKMKHFLMALFDLQPLELLCLQGIVKGKRLQEWADYINKTLNKSKMTRHHAFQLRKSTLSKLGEQFKDALMTEGQRKPLKGKEIHK